MITVKACIEIIIVPCGNAAANGNGHAQYIDEDIYFTLHHAS